MNGATDPRPSLAKIRAYNKGSWVDGVVIPREELDVLLDIAEAAQTLDTNLLHDAVAGDITRSDIDDLADAVAKVRP